MNLGTSRKNIYDFYSLLLEQSKKKCKKILWLNFQKHMGVLISYKIDSEDRYRYYNTIYRIKVKEQMF